MGGQGGAGGSDGSDSDGGDSGLDSAKSGLDNSDGGSDAGGGSGKQRWQGPGVAVPSSHCSDLGLHDICMYACALLL